MIRSRRTSCAYTADKQRKLGLLFTSHDTMTNQNTVFASCVSYQPMTSLLTRLVRQTYLQRTWLWSHGLNPRVDTIKVICIIDSNTYKLLESINRYKKSSWPELYPLVKYSFLLVLISPHVPRINVELIGLRSLPDLLTLKQRTRRNRWAGISYWGTSNHWEHRIQTTWYKLTNRNSAWRTRVLLEHWLITLLGHWPLYTLYLVI